jgi:AAA domain
MRLAFNSIRRDSFKGLLWKRSFLPPLRRLLGRRQLRELSLPDSDQGEAMYEPRVEQLADKSVNIYLEGLHFKLFPPGLNDRSDWKVWTEDGFQPVSNPTALRWLKRIWIEKIYRASSPPGRIPRFPRTGSKEIKRLLAKAKRAYCTGGMKKLASVCDRLKALSSGQSGGSVTSWSDIPLASDAPEQQLTWLAKGRIPLRQVTVIAAAKDSYKSMLMLALGKAATTDGKFLGMPVKQRRVLYLNRDMPKAVFDNYCETLNMDKSNRRFKILSSLWDTRIQPMAPDGPLLLRFAKRYHPVIIIDHLAKFFEGRMDSPRDVERFMEKLKQLTALGATVIVLHHVPKNDETSEGFGSVYIINNADFGWNITRKGGYAPEEATTIEIQNTKTKMGDYFRLKVRPLLSSKGMFEVFSEESREKESFDRDVAKVERLLSASEWTKKRDLCREAMDNGISRSKFTRICEFCVNRGSIEVKNSSRGLKKCRLVSSES